MTINVKPYNNYVGVVIKTDNAVIDLGLMDKKEIADLRSMLREASDDITRWLGDAEEVEG